MFSLFTFLKLTCVWLEVVLVAKASASLFPFALSAPLVAVFHSVNLAAFLGLATRTANGTALDCERRRASRRRRWSRRRFAATGRHHHFGLLERVLYIKLYLKNNVGYVTQRSYLKGLNLPIRSRNRRTTKCCGHVLE